MKIFSRLMFVILFTISLAACAPSAPVAPTDPSVESTGKVYPESDNSYHWSVQSKVTVNTQVYRLEVEVINELKSHTELNAVSGGSGYIVGGTGFATSYGRMWQDGKGLLPVKIVTLTPEFPGLLPGDTMIMKTSDLKAMGLPPGAVTTFLCNQDTEVISPVYSGQVLTTDRLTSELDDCRMLTPEYK